MNPVMVVHALVAGEDNHPAGRHCLIWCPGCASLHAPAVVGVAGDHPNGPCWEWDGNLDVPTFSPSLLCFHSAKPRACTVEHPHFDLCVDPSVCGQTSHYLPEGGGGPYTHTKPCPHGPNGNCHSFIRNGQWEFLSDSAHHLAGQTVPMVPLPDWLVNS